MVIVPLWLDQQMHFKQNCLIMYSTCGMTILLVVMYNNYYQYYLDYSFVENVLVCAVEDYVLPANIVLTSFCLFVILIRSLKLNWEALQVSTAKQVLN